MKRLLTATAIVFALSAPLVAQEARIDGTVAEAFGRQVVVATPQGRVLVTLPEGTDVPQPGTRLELTGTRSGDTFEASAVSAAAPVDTAELDLPQSLRGLGLSDVRTRPDDDGETYIQARLSEGGWLRAETRGERILEVQTDGTTLPDALVSTLLPEAARNHPRFAEMARIVEIDLDDDDEIEVDGFDASGMRIELEFTLAGDLKEYKRERDDRRSLTQDAARERLAELGYEDIGFVNRGGRHAEALARNPYGELVEVRLDDQGRVERERAWQR
jgi:hypothetical protein